MDNNYGHDKDMWLYLLLLNGGIGGFGRGGYGGYGPHAGGSPSIADEVAVHTLKVPTCAEAQASANAQEQRINDLQRDIGEIGRDLQNGLSTTNRDLLLHGAAAQAASERQASEIQRELAACCCETQKSILASQNATELGFKDVTAQLCAVERSLSDKMSDQERDRLNRELGDCKAALATANQTTVLSGIVGAAVNAGADRVTAQCCCDPCSNGHGGHGRGGGGGVTAVDVQNIVMNTVRAMGGGGGFTPPGQGKK